MIDFKTVCKNFTLLFESARNCTRNIFINSSLEIVPDIQDQASFQEIISALQYRKWQISTETPEEIDKNIKRIWCQTMYLYRNNTCFKIQDLKELYQNSIIQGLFVTSHKIDEYASKIREQCEKICIQKCICQIKKMLLKLPEDLTQLAIQSFQEEIERTYEQVKALENTEEFELLLDWYNNYYDKFLGVFLDELDEKIERCFVNLFELFTIAYHSYLNKKKLKSKSSYHNVKKKIPHEKITPKDLRKKILSIIEKAPSIEISLLDMIKFLYLKNFKNLQDSSFRYIWSNLKKFHNIYDKIESDKKLLRQEQNEKKIKKTLNHFQMKMIMKIQFLQNVLPYDTLFAKIVMLKLKNSSFFNRNIESNLLRSFIKNFQEPETKIENYEIIYDCFLQELEKIQNKKNDSIDDSLYKMSKKTQDFFTILGENRTQLFSIKEFNDLKIPILQPIFNEEESLKIETFFEKSKKENMIFWEEMLNNMYQNRSEFSKSKKDIDSSKQTKIEKKTRTKKSLEEEIKTSPKISIPITLKNWNEIIPIKTTNKVNLLYPIHVTRWFDNPIVSLKDPKYRFFIETIGKQECLYFHSFPKIIDQFVGTNYSLQNEVFNQRTRQNDLLYGIPGEFEIKGKKYRGFFQYIIDSKSGICYHRCFNFRNKNFIQDLVEEKIWYPNDFPTLDQSKNYKGEKVDSFVFDGINIQYDSILKKIYIINEQIKIILFNNFDSELINEVFELLDK